MRAWRSAKSEKSDASRSRSRRLHSATFSAASLKIGGGEDRGAPDHLERADRLAQECAGQNDGEERLERHHDGRAFGPKPPQRGEHEGKGPGAGQAVEDHRR